MNGRYTIAKEFGIKLEEINGIPVGVPYISFTLPNNDEDPETRQLLELKFRKWKVCDENGNIKEAWFLSSEAFDLPS